MNLTTINVKLIDQDGNNIPYGPPHPAVRVSNPSGAFLHYCDGAGTVSIENLPTGIYLVEPIAEGYSADPINVEMPHDDQIVIRMTRIASPVTGLSPLRLNGNQLVNNEGSVFLKGASYFAAFDKLLRGGEADLRAAMRQLQDLNCNMIRVWLMSVNVQANLFGWPPLDPRTYGSAGYEAIPTLAGIAAEYGHYIYWGLCPDIGLLGMSRQEQQDHIDRSAARITLGLAEGMNEAAAHNGNQVADGVTLRGFQVPWCGTSYSDSDPAYASGTYPEQDRGGVFGDIHPSRSYPAHYADCSPVKNIYFLSNKGLLIGEPDRYGSGGNDNPRAAYLSASSARAGAMGIVFHSINGEKAEAFDDTTMRNAKEFFRAFDTI